MVHPNEMVHWPDIRCQRNHTTHQRRLTTVPLADNDSYHDYPRIPSRFAGEFEVEVWDYRKYLGDGPYCPGHDVVSEVIYELGVWEQCETAVMLMCFEAAGAGAWFVDFGSQVGWYSVLAGRMGLNVFAIDADPECAKLTADNLERTTMNTDMVYGVIDARVTQDFEPLSKFSSPSDQGVPVVVKIDVEGAEKWAVGALRHMLGDVQFMLIEISPVFNDTYLDLTWALIGEGFQPYEIPPRGDPPIVLDQLTDLRPFHLDGDAVDAIPTWHQRNVLFVRGGL